MDEICPHLGIISGDSRRQSPVEFPSFENQCLALDTGELILLGDQATYCFSRQYRTCPRFRRAESRELTGTEIRFVPFYGQAEDAWQSVAAGAGDEEHVFEPLLGLDESSDLRVSRRRWAWIGAGLVFASVFLCGSMVASYTGWQWISRNLPARTVNGRVDTVSSIETGPTPAVYLVHTATPEPQEAVPGIVGPTAPVIVVPPGGSADEQSLPVAVTPTPIVVELPPQLAEAVSGEELPGSADPAPLINVDVPIPTRRPTPVFDLPTSTALVADLPTPTETPTPVPLGTPIIVFGPDDTGLKEGSCTLVRWSVKNVREVYYENLPMAGQGEREECMDDEDEMYTLLVVLGDGSSQIFTTTVSYLPPTPTPTVTPSFTPEPEFTPTWTPEPPTATPTPDVQYGVVLAASAETQISCDRGATCEVGLLVTNSGDTSDTLVITIVENGTFSSQLCRPDGVCAGNDLSITGVGPGNTAYVMLRVAVPADAASAQSATYGLVASSDGSGRNVTSAQVNVGVTTP